ncbi:MAG: ADP-forming succinate--CoA ligase subunit beta [Pseudomonadota bacterium]|nr:ADP-forming succinate--CoA ligase subunit beta [Pseudomonadota bacterium]
MNLHEYQAKHLFAQYGLPVPRGQVVWNIEEAISAANTLGGDRFVVKAQVHAGGRGKSGGVKLVKGQEELISAVKGMLGTRLVTYQTDVNGQPVNQILIEELSDIANELYVGAVIDRAQQRVVFMLSTEGGVEIEKVAEESPEKIITVVVDPLLGMMPFQTRKAGFALELNDSQIKQLGVILQGLYKMMIDLDFSLLEVNPLIINKDGKLICLDGKINIDGSALYRQPVLREMRDPSQEDERENRAAQWELNYIALDGDIGCMVNGAGLAMATMDLIKLEGGSPANFLDVGGGATKERVTEAFKIILSDKNVKGVLVNIFGGIVRCDLIADGIIGAVAEVGIEIPVVVRLEGNNAALGAKRLAESGLNITPATSFTDAAQRIVAMVKG